MKSISFRRISEILRKELRQTFREPRMRFLLFLLEGWCLPRNRVGDRVVGPPLLCEGGRTRGEDG